jgi:signal transduction histidine kinase
MTGCFSDNDHPGLSFIETFSDDDQPVIRALWDGLVQNGQNGVSANCQARLKRTYEPPIRHDWLKGSQESHPVWVLVQGFPLKDEEEIELIMMCFTDISALKWAESLQSRIATAAEKSKRKQEEFIDITSHEMRNPLSAMMQVS